MSTRFGEAQASRFDTIREAETPEGVILSLRPAGPVARSFAWLIDALIRGVIYLALALVLPHFGSFGIGVMLLLLFLIEWFYPVAFELLMNGATPGKAALGLRVMSADGLPVGWYGSLTRNILRAVDFLPVAYGLGLAAMLTTRHFQRLGDLAGDTLVVYAKSIEERGQLPSHEGLPVPSGLDVEEQRAIVDYAQRLPYISSGRAEELALALKPWLGEDATPGRLAGMAMTIVGKKGAA